MEDISEEGTYRALPQIGDDIMEFILHDDAGPVSQFSQSLADIGSALQRVDEEMQGLSIANANLASIVHGTVEGLYSAFSEFIPSEQGKAMLRAVGHINAFVVLRALDMQWRRSDSP